MASQNITNFTTVAIGDMTGDWYVPVAKVGQRTKKVLASTALGGGGGGGVGALTIVDYPAGHVFTTGESGIGNLYTNSGASGLVAFTLPAAAAGLHFRFIVYSGYGITVDAGAGDYILPGQGSVSTGSTIDIYGIGQIIELVAVNSDGWFMTTLAGLTDDGWVNVKAFRAVGNNNGDDTPAVQAAAAVALATATSWGSKGLWFPPTAGGGYLCTGTTDLRGIAQIKCESNLISWGALTGPAFKIGFSSSAGGGRFEFYGIYRWNETYAEARHPVVQLSGMHGAYFRVGSNPCFIEIYGDNDTAQYKHCSFSEFHLGSTWRLELRDNGISNIAYLNSNMFFGGAMAQLRIVGPWIDVTSIVGTTVTTTTPHGFSTGDQIEMYNGVPADGAFRLVTVTDATHFELASTFAGSGNAGTGWRCCGPPGYYHNDNQFWCPDIEDAPAIVNMQGWYNRLERARIEATGTLAFGTDAVGNMVEASNFSQHGPVPQPADFPLTVIDASNGTNAHGWVQPPKPWGGVIGVTAKTATYTIRSYVDHGKTFDNTGASAIVPFVLPATSVAETTPVGFEVSFYVADTDGIRVTASGTETIRVLASVSGAGGKIESTTIGDYVKLRCVAAGKWAAIDTNRAAGWTVT